MFRSQPLSVIATLILITNTAFGAASTNLGGVFFPWVTVNKTASDFLTKEPQRWRGSLPETDLNFGEFQVKARGVQWDVYGQISGLSWSAQGAKLNATRFSARLAIEEISVDQVIERRLGGNVIRVHLQARCGPLRLRQDAAQIGGELSLLWKKLAPQISVSKASLSWPANSWVLEAFTCSGPAGFDKLLKDQVIAGLANAELVKPWLEKGLRDNLPTLASTIEEKLQQILSFTMQGTDRSLRAIDIRSLDQGLWISMGLHADADASEPPEAARLQGQDPLLWLRSSALTELVKDEWSRSVPEWTSTDLRQNEGFLSLLKSRFLQFFVWPDLWNYSKSSPFKLAVQRPDISAWKENSPLRFTGPIQMNAWIQSQRGGRTWNYVSIQGSGQGELSMSLREGRLNLAAQAKASSVRTAFGAEYRRTYPATGWLASSILNSALTAKAISFAKTWDLPRIDLGAAGLWQAHELQSESGDWLRVPFKNLETGP